MKRTFDEILDECMNRINRGETLEDCVDGYPEQAAELEPLLQAMLDAQTACGFTPSPEAKMAARQRFNAALQERERRRQERQPLIPRIFGWGPAWAAVTAVLLLAIVGYFGIRPALSPGGIGPQPSMAGNFEFLISDERNAIGDFKSLDISISKIGLHMAGENSEWIEIDPEVKQVDLTFLQGDRAQEIWSGNITEGRYTKVFIYVESVSGVLVDGNETDVRLPSDKLQISKTFEVTADSITSFVYDLTVVASGNEQSGIKYHLRPQIGDSGVDQNFDRVTPTE